MSFVILLCCTDVPVQVGAFLLLSCVCTYFAVDVWSYITLNVLTEAWCH